MYIVYKSFGGHWEAANGNYHSIIYQNAQTPQGTIGLSEKITFICKDVSLSYEA